MNEPLWECPKCGYLIADIQMQSFKCDVWCPRCRMPLAFFTVKADKKLMRRK